MNESLHDIDKLFHDGIEGHSEYPPKKVWDKIEANLDKTTAVIYKKKYKTIKRVAAILLLLFLSVLIYEIVNRHPGKNDVAGSEQRDKQSGDHRNQKDKKTDNLAQKNNNEVINQEQNKDDQLANKQDDLTPVGKENHVNDQPSVVATDDSKKSHKDDSKKDLAYPDLKDNRLVNPGNIVKDNNDKKGKQNISNPPIKNNKPGTETATGKDINGKEKAVVTANPPVITPAKDDDITFGGDKIKRSLSFTLTPVGLWKKNLLTDTNPSASVPENTEDKVLKQFSRPVNKKAANRVFRNYGFALSLFFSPNTSWSNLEDDEPYRPSSPGGGGGGGPVDHNEIKKTEENSFAYSGGIKLSYGLSKKISVQTGLNYTKSSTSVGTKDVYADRDNNGNIRYRVDCSSGYTYVRPHSGSNPSPGDKITMSDNRNSISYLGIPISVEYRISFGKFILSPSAGAQLNILLKGKTTAVLGKGTSNETPVSSSTEGLKSTYVSAVTSITGELLLNKKLSLTIAPSGQFALSSINNGASVKTKPNYAGLAAGIKIKL